MVKPLFARCPKHRVDIGRRDLLRGKREKLFEQRLGVAHRAGGPAGEQIEGLPIGRDTFRIGNLGKPGADRGRLNPREIETLAARGS